MATLQIIIKNKSSENQQFMIFTEKPTYSENGANREAWTNIWGTSPGTGAPNGSATFEIVEEYFAICGNNPEELRKGLVVSTSDYDQVKITSGSTKGDNDFLTMYRGGLTFDAKRKTNTSVTGAYALSTDEWTFKEYPNVFSGLGMQSPIPGSPEVIPVAVWHTKPNTDYIVVPKRKYYISTGDFKPGKIVDRKELGKICEIDFTGKSEDIAVVEYRDTLAFGAVNYGY